MRILLAMAAICCWLFLAVSEPASPVNVRTEDLLVSPPGANWTSYNGDYSGRRYSSLSEINVHNVGQLRADWVFHARNKAWCRGSAAVKGPIGREHGCWRVGGSTGDRRVFKATIGEQILSKSGNGVGRPYPHESPAQNSRCSAIPPPACWD